METTALYHIELADAYVSEMELLKIKQKSTI